MQRLAQLSHPCCRSASRSASRSRSPARSGSRSPPRSGSPPRSVSPQRYASAVHLVDGFHVASVGNAYSMASYGVSHLLSRGQALSAYTASVGNMQSASLCPQQFALQHEAADASCLQSVHASCTTPSCSSTSLSVTAVLGIAQFQAVQDVTMTVLQGLIWSRSLSAAVSGAACTGSCHAWGSEIMKQLFVCYTTSDFMPAWPVILVCPLWSKIAEFCIAGKFISCSNMSTTRLKCRVRSEAQAFTYSTVT